MKDRRKMAGPKKQRGAAIVEFAIACAVLVSVLIGIMEFSRVLYYWNTATEAARLGARVATVCDVNASVIKTKMEQMLPLLSDSNIQVSYTPSGCDATNCTSVTVGYTGLTVSTFVPFVPISMTLPPFATTLPRESLSSASGGSVCQ
ncbi:Flp pilus assembly protein TadG [Trinickia symbiotica]|uniref:Pilus assembly protein n=1 Tax=Trinickia symbiotica TaxID=863227 RepID=A0A2N7XAA3_9BURK|nr:TadE/TadG family type IV pilus assembly protein [Trinickia symbiotica]PMS38668.1 pilus assembly protein [Trinickia symbiotica]PPK46683.1 Flp pilus assembly protein TadG [Trinickia symbiotica]